MGRIIVIRIRINLFQEQNPFTCNIYYVTQVVHINTVIIVIKNPVKNTKSIRYLKNIVKKNSKIKK